MNYWVVLCCACSAFISTTAKANDEMNPPLSRMPREEYNWRPDTCKFGYKMNEGTYLCEPLCEPPCTNGECTEPGVCSCSPGFHQSSDTNVCAPTKPICKVDCVKFDCIEDGKCVCLNRSTGYMPSPSECECPHNYKKTTRDRIAMCTPICEPPCINGECIEAGKCKCFSGFSNQTANVCNPLCKAGCVNSTCVRDGECECIVGYEKHQLDPYKCRPSCLACTEDECIKPNVCQCPAGSTKLYIETQADKMSLLNRTALNLAFCLPLSSATNETSPFLVSLAGATSASSIIILLLLAVLVMGILAISMSYHRNRWTAYRVNNSGRGNRDFSENGDQRVELQSVNSDEQ